MAKYTEMEKYEAVRLYMIMGKEGTCYIANKPIHNIRALCSALGISSQSLYRWVEVKEIESDDLEVLGFEGEGDVIPEGVNFYDDDDMGLPDSEIEPMTFKMGTTFFQTLAQGLGIKNYRMPLKQLYLTIGTELIKLSGLVENGVREELRIE